MSNYKISGFVDKGFESVRDLFEENFRIGRDSNAGLVVYWQGKKVIDLSGTVSTYNSQSSLQICFSTSKLVVAVCVGILVERGFLDYDARISDYWPEFASEATSEKSQVTIADLLRHDSGLPWPDRIFDTEQFSTQSIKDNVMGRVFEEEALQFPDAETRDECVLREYHGTTYGLIANEVVRRVDPQRRTLGEFIKDELYLAQGLDIHCAVKDEAILERICDLELPNPFTAIALAWVPSAIYERARRVPSIGEILQLTYHSITGYASLMKRIDRLRLRDFQYFFGVFWRSHFCRDENGHSFPSTSIELINSRGFKEIEFSSINVVASAQGLGQLAGIMANRGALGDAKLINPSTWRRMHAQKIIKNDLFFGGCRTEFSQGGINHFHAYADDVSIEEKFKLGRNGFCGWIGLGGSTCQWHPELNIGFAFAPTTVAWYDLFNEKAGRLQAEVVRCVREMNAQSSKKPVRRKRQGRR